MRRPLFRQASNHIIHRHAGTKESLSFPNLSMLRARKCPCWLLWMHERIPAPGPLSLSQRKHIGRHLAECFGLLSLVES